MMFRDRKDGGRGLAQRLAQYRGRADTIVLALPRGGVVTGFEIARELEVPLDVLIVRKIGYPGQPELAAGAVAETGSVVMNEAIVAGGGFSERYFQPEIDRQKEEIVRRVALYRGGRELPDLGGKTVILVDDGVATGATIKAAIAALKQEKPGKLIIALPVGPPETVNALRRMADAVICLATPLMFMAVGGYYQDFTQVTDEQVVELLKTPVVKAA